MCLPYLNFLDMLPTQNTLISYLALLFFYETFLDLWNPICCDFLNKILLCSSSSSFSCGFSVGIRYIMQCHHKLDTRCEVRSVNHCHIVKLYYDKQKILTFFMDMTRV